MRNTTAAVVLTMTAAASPVLAAGLLQPRDANLPALEIRDHQVQVVINNGFAITEVDQTFHNPHDLDLDAVYTFPLPRDATLSELGMWIDGDEVIGEVVEKERGREIMRREREAGRESALAEKRSYVAFDVFVSPVPAGADTRVRLVYLQPVEVDAGVGRYVYPLQEGGVDAEVQAFWDRDEVVRGRFRFEGTIRSSYPLDAVRVPGYDTEARIEQNAPDTWSVRIEPEEGAGTTLDRDVVVYYRLAEELPARVDMLTHRRGGPGTFMVVITPGADLELIDEGVDWSVVLDLSGSMAGKLVAASEAVARALDHFPLDDRFRIVTFADRARVLQDWTTVSLEEIARAKQRLLALEVDGGTNLYDGFRQGLRDLAADRTSAVILISDGGANVGPTQHSAFLELLDRKDVRVFTFVMGQGTNAPLLERLARDSSGFSMAVSNEDDLYGRLLEAKAKLTREALHGVEVELEGAEVAELAPRRLASAYFGQQIVLLGRYRAPGEAVLRLRARISGKERSWATRVTLPETDTTYPELERLWAFARVKDLQERIEDGGEKKELRRAIVDLATEFSFVTDYTSMIVVRPERFADYDLDRENRDRVEGERLARDIRVGRPAPETRADAGRPMFGQRRAPRLGGGDSGLGAVDPLSVGLLAILVGGQAALRRRSRRR